MNRAATCVVLLWASLAHACLWDYDTIDDERRGLPGVAEIIAGRWERHSKAFYEHRIAAMTAILKDRPDDLAAWDNLAVAYEKVGDVDRAIETILHKDRLKPGEYTTHANLGTFYLHKGDLDAGIEHIRRALAINPNAHFGREKYQLQVAEFLKNPPPADKDGKRGSFVLPLLLPEWKPASRPTEDDTLRERASRMRRHPGRDDRPEINAAIAGVVGMIRFGTGTSPHLYYALGDLLAARGDKALAYRAYIRAIELNHPSPEEVRTAAEDVKEVIHEPGDLNGEFVRARGAADAWVAAYQAHEARLLAEGRDAEDEAQIAAFYQKHGSPREPLPWRRPRLTKERLIVVGGLATVGAYVGFRLWQRRRATTRHRVA